MLLSVGLAGNAAAWAPPVGGSTVLAEGRSAIRCRRGRHKTAVVSGVTGQLIGELSDASCQERSPDSESLHMDLAA